MKKRLASLLLAICLLLPVMPAAMAEPLFKTIDEVVSHLRSCADFLQEEIVFEYSPSLDTMLKDGEKLDDIMYNCGMIDWKWRWNGRKITLYDIEYYPGFKIARAVSMEITEILNEDERAALSRAREMVTEACMYAQSPYESLRQIHDALIRQVTYREVDDESGWVYEDTALGALLYGFAECDGYSDAFYLLCWLANFDAGFQYGTADGMEGEDTHLWNLIKIDDLWYQVDVTWDDPDYEGYPDMCRYRYFIVGSEMMEDHQWDESLSPYTQASWNNWDWFFYTCDNTGLAYGAYFGSLKDAANYVVYMKKQSWKPKMIHVMVDGTYEDAVYFNDVMEEAGLKGSWTTWTKNMGKYTCFDVLIFK